MRFPRRQRLSSNRDFQQVHRRGLKRGAGPILVASLPNDLPFARLGLSVGRSVGGAVVRNTVKRRLREAFRLSLEDIPAGFDYVLIVRPHTPLSALDYRDRLIDATRRLAERWAERTARTETHRQDSGG